MFIQQASHGMNIHNKICCGCIAAAVRHNYIVIDTYSWMQGLLYYRWMEEHKWQVCVEAEEDNHKKVGVIENWLSDYRKY